MLAVERTVGRAQRGAVHREQLEPFEEILRLILGNPVPSRFTKKPRQGRRPRALPRLGDGALADK